MYTWQKNKTKIFLYAVPTIDPIESYTIELVLFAIQTLQFNKQQQEVRHSTLQIIMQ
jgi:hypothetical protein